MMPLLPIDTTIMNSLILHFNRMALITTSLVSFLFVARLVVLVIGIATHDEYFSLIKETASYFIIITLFPKVFVFTNEIIGSMAIRFYWEPIVDDENYLNQIFTLLKQFYPFLNLFHTLGIYIISHTAQAISALLISILVSVGPVVILLNTLLSFNNGVGIYLNALLSLCLWPVLWNMLGSLSNEFSPFFNSTSLMKVVFWWCVFILQIFSPLISSFLLKSFSPGKAITAISTKLASF